MNNHAIDLREIGSRIQRARQNLHMTQQELARRIGVSTAYIGHIERGMKSCSLEIIAKLCQSLDLSADYVLFGRESSESKTAVIRRYLEQQLAGLPNSIADCSTEG